ncbi:hypothetical protein Z043_119136 [Scleropages formosus]|uniref:Uncharacterized protein n=1 Tax=Scleropages formosus TaxID=113540 RepID=A0A0P7TYF1_SCLFO|nr:hypothetical protein Z043_119136 [Scleropages formosus]
MLSGKTAFQMGKDPSVQLPRPDLQVLRCRSKTYPKRVAQAPAANNMNRSNATAENGENEAAKNKFVGPSSGKSGLYNSAGERNKSPKFPAARRRTPSGGSENEASQPGRRRELSMETRKELVDPSGLTEEQLKEIPYKKVETQGDPIRIRHSHSPRSFRQYRRSQCSDGERSVLSEVNSRNDFVAPLPVTRTAETPGSSAPSTQQKKSDSKDNLTESRDPEVKCGIKVVKMPHALQTKAET